jgi:hypothetical protein
MFVAFSCHGSLLTIPNSYPFIDLPPSVSTVKFLSQSPLFTLPSVTKLYTSPTHIHFPFVEICTGATRTEPAMFRFGPGSNDTNQRLYKTFRVLFGYYFLQKKKKALTGTRVRLVLVTEN